MNEVFKMSIKDRNFEAHPATHFAIVIYRCLNQLQIVVGLVISQEAPNNCD